MRNVQAPTHAHRIRARNSSTIHLGNGQQKMVHSKEGKTCIESIVETVMLLLFFFCSVCLLKRHLIRLIRHELRKRNNELMLIETIKKLVECALIAHTVLTHNAMHAC